MSRLDRHVAMVQNKLALGRFLHALAWAGLVYASAVWVAILVDRVFHVRPPRPDVWLFAGAGAALLAALGYAMWKRPTPQQAAVAIDAKLALKEKFSTALYARPLNDPFAHAAVLDAERTAEQVSLHKRFPLAFPRATYGTILVALAAFLTASFMKPLDLFGREEQQKKQFAEEAKREEARKVLRDALAKVEAMPKAVADDDAIQIVKKDLEEMLAQPIKDPQQAKRNAAKALADVSQALKNQAQTSQKYADAQQDAKAFRSLLPPDDEKGPVADAQRKIAKGDFGAAIDDIAKAAEQFNKMDEKEKAKAAEQMQKMAQQLQQMANDPKAQQQMQQQLQQLGMNQQQAQQMAQQMQQAAQGDKQAQQQLAQQQQQMMQQLQQQANAGNQQAQQQMQQIQQAMQQIQAQANAQQQAAQMQQAAQQMAQAMQQAAQAQQQQQPGQQPGQQAQGQQAQQGQPGGQQPGQQQMQQGAQAMQQQLQQMQAMQNDAQQVAAAQQAAADAAGQAAGGLNNGQGQGQGQGQPDQQQAGNWQGQQGDWAPGDPNQQGGNNQGQGGGPGQAMGDRTYKAQAPYGVKQEVSTSEDIDDGRVLASTFIKAKNEKGTSAAQLQEMVTPTEQEATDEVDQERVSRQAQKVVRDYFKSVHDEAAKQ
jgi:hypothetical protein